MKQADFEARHGQNRIVCGGRMALHKGVGAGPVESAAPTGAWYFWWHCDGCNDQHCVIVQADDLPVVPTGHGSTTRWTFDGNFEAPTFSPSLLHHASNHNPTCHVYIKGGRVEYLSDCGHQLAGRTVPPGPLPEWLTR